MPVPLLARVLRKTVLLLSGLQHWLPLPTRTKRCSCPVSSIAAGPHRNRPAAAMYHHRHHLPWTPFPSPLPDSGTFALDQCHLKSIRWRTTSPFAGLLRCSPHVTQVLQIHLHARMIILRTSVPSTISPLLNFLHQILESCLWKPRLYEQALLPPWTRPVVHGEPPRISLMASHRHR